MEYLIHLAILSAIYAILAISLNLVIGYTGLLSVTHAAFYGVGAYVTAIFLTSFGINFFLSVAIGVAISCVVALVSGIILSRFRDDYYALASFGLNVIIYSVFLNWQSVTRGPLGIPGIARPSILGSYLSSNTWFLVLSIVVLAAVYFLSHFITSSSFGRVLKAIREDEEAIQVFGYNTIWYKLVIFVISGGMAAIAGSLFASYITFVDPSTFTLNESIFILAMVILGGLASLRGSVLGAVLLILIPEALRFVGMPNDIAAQMRQVFYGLILILLMLYRPQGLLGKFRL